VERKETEQREK
jgi:hypothetical protein